MGCEELGCEELGCEEELGWEELGWEEEEGWDVFGFCGFDSSAPILLSGDKSGLSGVSQVSHRQWSVDSVTVATGSKEFARVV